MSDTHMAGSDGNVKVPDGDLLIHAGDLTYRGTEHELELELEWLDSLPHAHKVVIAGNHDWLFQDDAPPSFHNWPLKRTKAKVEMLNQYPSLTYLEGSSVEIDGFKVYGDPHQPWFYGWAFNFPEHDLLTGEVARKTWAKIPNDTNILITHGPPIGMLDATYPDDSRAGCPKLWNRVQTLDVLRLHCFGHLHESYGREGYDGMDGYPNMTFVNASIMTREYMPLNKPIVVDL